MKVCHVALWGILASGLIETIYLLVARPYLPAPAPHPNGGMLRHQLDGVVQVPGLEHQDAAELFLRFSERAIGDGHLAVLVPHCVG